MPPMPTAERIDPTTSTCQSGVRHLADEFDSDEHHRDDDDLADEGMRHERYVVMKPPINGPTAAAMAAAAPTSA